MSPRIARSREWGPVRHGLAALGLAWTGGGVLAAAEPLAVAPPPVGETVRLPVSRDTWVSGVGDEADGNQGGSPRLKFKSYQEFSLLDLDPEPLRGRIVLGATLVLFPAGEERLHRVTVSGIGAEWHEGTASGYSPQPGSATFRHRKHPDLPWAEPAGDITAVIFGGAGQPWASVDAVPPEENGRQRIAVDPKVVQARIAGISQGFVVFDDTGSEWSRRGMEFSQRPFPNRFFVSREGPRERRPHWLVYLGDRDDLPPEGVGALRADTTGCLPGEAVVSWTTPIDKGGAGTIGFVAELGDTAVPRFRIPAAGAPGSTVRMTLADPTVRPGTPANLRVRAVDGAGNLGAPRTLTVTFAPADRLPELPTPLPVAIGPVGPWPRVGGASLAVVDALDKLDLRTNRLVPPAPDGYFTANHLWDASRATLRLSGARRETIAFQLLLEDPPQRLTAEIVWKNLPTAPKATWQRFETVPGEGGLWADPLVPFDPTAPLPAVTGAGGKKFAFLLGELDLPADLSPGEHEGELRLTADGMAAAFVVKLESFDFEMPREISFLPELNCYDLPADERNWYRLAHRHRTVLNRVPYHQNGRVDEGCAPAFKDGKLEWTACEKRFRSLFDGSLFADSPRGAVPIECFYLPLHENWPLEIEKHYNGNDWAQRAFTPEYRHTLTQTSREFAEKLSALSADRTLFHVFLNGKNDFKRNGWARGSSPWLLDEPAHFQDFLALRWFGEAFLEGAAAADPSARIVFRADISRPQWQRTTLDGLLDYNVVAGGPLRRYEHLVRERAAREGQLTIEYGTANRPEDSNLQAVAWSWAAWCRGADGILPWNTIGKAESWNKTDPLALLYPGEPRGLTGPVPSIRLTAFRRGQQDLEYLLLRQARLGLDRRRLGTQVQAALKLNETRRSDGTYAEDAGTAGFRDLRPETLAAFRLALGRELSKLKGTALPTPIVERLRTRRSISPLKWEVEVGERPATADRGHYRP